MTPRTKDPEFTALDLLELLQFPEARQAAVKTGWVQGVEFDVRVLAAGMANFGYYVTAGLAWEVGRCTGWNLRCNRCGTYGARWLAEERPGWGSLAVCPQHKDELTEEHRRHDAALAVLRKVNFEQTDRTIQHSRHGTDR